MSAHRSGVRRRLYSLATVEVRDTIGSLAPSDAAGAVRRDRRPRPQDDLPGALRDGEAGVLNVPVVGVAFSGWSLAQLRRRAADGIRETGRIDNARALRHLLSLLRYVDGDYNDPGTFAALKQALGSARRPAHYLAIPPSLFGTVIRGSAPRGWRTTRASSSRSRLAATWLPRASSTASRGRCFLKMRSSASITSSGRKRS